VKSNNPRRCYSDLNITNLGTVHHLGFDRIWIFKGFVAYADPQSIHNPHTNLHQIERPAAELSMIQLIFLASFSGGGNFVGANYQSFVARTMPNLGTT